MPRSYFLDPYLGIKLIVLSRKKTENEERNASTEHEEELS